MESLLASALEAARIAAPVIKAAFTNRSLQGILDLKSNSSDLVTATDKAVEQLLFAHLRQLHPTHSFIGEETYDNAQLTDNYTWVIDPVDGTTNFVHGFPYTCVSVALVFEKRAVVGVVLNPILNETFYAAKGLGAWMIDADGVTHALPLHGLKPWAGFARSLISTEYGYERDKRLDSKLKSLTSVLKAPARGVRSLGSAALEACYTARGTFDLYWEAGVHMWDVAAAAVIVEEAGGVIANFDPAVPEGSNEEFLDLAQRKFIVVRPMEGGKTEAWAVVKELRSHLEMLEYERD